MKTSASLRQITLSLTLALVVVPITSRCVADDDVAIVLTSNGVVETNQSGLQSFDANDQENLAKLKQKVKNRRLVVIVEEDVPAEQIAAFRDEFTNSDVALKGFSVTRVKKTKKTKKYADAVQNHVEVQRAAMADRDRALERLSILFDERQARQMEKIELQMKKLEALKRKVEQRAKRKAEIVAQQVESSLAKNIGPKRVSNSLVNLRTDTQSQSNHGPTSVVRDSKTEVDLRKNDVELAEVNLDRALTKLNRLKPAFEKNMVSRSNLQDAEFDVRQAELELKRAKILLEEASHQTSNAPSSFSPAQSQHLQRMLENALQQAQAVADEQSTLAEIAEAQYAAGATTQKSVIEAQAKQKIASLEIKKIQMQIEALQGGFWLPAVTNSINALPADTSGPEAAQENLVRSLALPNTEAARLSNERVSQGQDVAEMVKRLAEMQAVITKLTSLGRRDDASALAAKLRKEQEALKNQIHELQKKPERTAVESNHLEKTVAKLDDLTSELEGLEAQLAEMEDANQSTSSN